MSDLFVVPPDRSLSDARHSAARDQLVAAASKRRKRFSARWRNTGIVLGLGVGLSVGGGVALAQGLFSQAPEPGSPSETQLAKPVVATRTGTATIDLGHVPRRANAISLTLTGLSAGTFTYVKSSYFECAQSDVSRSGPRGCTDGDVIPLQPGQHSITITTSANASWRLRATYVHQVITAWKVNAHGQTYGAANKNGLPDLVAVAFEADKSGYVSLTDFLCPNAVPGENFSLPVYKSDGTTRIGTFIVGNKGPGIRTVPVSSLHCPKADSFGTHPGPQN
jgi:hypothetical protein